MVARKIDLMHEMFGKAPGTCKECFNFMPARGGYSKCRIYGISKSEATDWNNRFPACGKKNNFYKGGMVVKMIKREKAEEVFPGQISLFEIPEG